MFDSNFAFHEKFSLKDKIPKDYDKSAMAFTFDFIYLVYKRNAIVSKAIEGVAREYNLSESFLKQYLIENKFILNKLDRKSYLAHLKDYPTKYLKRVLKANGIKTSGKREKIEERIIENRLLSSNYQLSYKSKMFYKNKKRRMDLFEDYLYDNYYFDEFNEYYMDNFRKKKNKIPIDFVNKYIEKAVEDKNHRDYVLNTQVLGGIYYKYKNCKKTLENILKIYCVNLNPVWICDDLSNHGGLAVETYNSLLYLKDKMGKNRIISAYLAIWDTFNFDSFIVTKQIGYWYLKDILNGRKDYFTILEELDEKYYSNEDLKIKKITQKTLFDF